MRKSKLNWQLATNPFDVYVLDPFRAVKRVHAPLAPSLSGGDDEPPYLHLRASAEGLDEDGTVVAYLYSTHDGRFFDRGKDGWGEHKYDFHPANINHEGGSDYPFMRNFGALKCHLLVAHAWIGKRPQGKVCDHKDTNKFNLNADNFEWVFPTENDRRAGIARKMRSAGIDPKLIYTNILDGIFKLPDELIGTLTGTFLFFSQTDFGDKELNITNINACLLAALDECYDRAHVR